MQCAPMQASQRRSWAEECVCVELSKSIGADEVVIGMNIEENIIAWAIKKNLMCIHMYTIMKFYILSLIFKAQHKKMKVLLLVIEFNLWWVLREVTDR